MSLLRPLRSLLPPFRLSSPLSARSCSSCSRSGIASTLFTGLPTIPCPAARTTSAGPARGPIGMAVSAGAQRGMKVRSSIKKLCDGCSVVKRKGYLYVVCSKDPKHKQRQG